MRPTPLDFSQLQVRLLAVITTLMATNATSAQVVRNVLALDTQLTENFNTLAATGTSSSLPAGFSFYENGGDSTYAAGTGSATVGNTYSFGLAGATDRAFGTLLSGSVTPRLGGFFRNTTGRTINSFTISYTGEQYRVGAANRVDRLDFGYSGKTGLTTAPTSIFLNTNTNFTNFDSLDFVAPVTSPVTNDPTVPPLNGNLSSNRRTLTATIDSLSIANNSYFVIRFDDFNATGSDDGLAIDDFSISASAVPEPTTTAFAAVMTIAVGLRRSSRSHGRIIRRAIRFAFGRPVNP